MCNLSSFSSRSRMEKTERKLAKSVLEEIDDEEGEVRNNK